MHYFRMISTFSTDDKYQQCFNELGYQGQVLWFNLLGIIAEHYKGNPEEPIEFFGEILRIRSNMFQKNFKSSLKVLENIFKIKIETSEKLFKVEYPKFMEIQYKYKRDGAGKFKVNNSNNNSNNKSNNKKGKPMFDFDKIWQKYPNKDGRKEAERHFNDSVKTQEDYDNIFKALENYLNCETVKKGYIKNGSTWFNNWQDWTEVKKPNNQPSEENMRQIYGEI